MNGVVQNERAARPSARRTGGQSLQRKCDNCGKRRSPKNDCPACRGKGKRLQRKAAGAQQWPAIPPVVHQVLRSPGVALDADTQSFMGTRFGLDFSRVRIHHDPKAATSAAAVNALAYTVGHHVVFGEGQYRPGSREGRGLLAHELTHVLQQNSAAPDIERLAIDDGEYSAAEAEAERISQAVVAEQALPEIGTAAANTVHRLPGSPAGGCGLCYGAPNLVGLATHPLIEAAFIGRYPWLQAELTFPVLTPSPGDDNGRLDLAELVGRDRINIAEIKPSNVAGLLQGDLDLFWYEDQLEALGFSVGRLNLPPPIDPIPFPTLAPPDCPQEQDMFVDPAVNGVYTYWCQPDFAELIAICDCTDGRRRRREPREEPVDVPVPVPVPVPEAPRVPETRPEGRRPPVEVPERPPVEVPERPPVPVPGPRPEGEPSPEGEPEPPGEIIPFPVPRPQPGGEPAPGEEPGPGEEVPIAAMVAAMLAAGAYALRRQAQRLPGQAAGRALAYVQAIALVGLIVFYSDRVEARPGGGESPLEALFRAMGEQGVAVPEDLRQRIEEDPELRRILEQAAVSGDVSAAQEALSRQMLDVIAENPDEFSEEDLQILFSTREQVADASGAPSPSVDSLRAAIEARRRGESVADAVRGGGQPGAGGAGGGEGGEGPAPAAPGEGGGTGTREQHAGERYPGLGAEGRRQLAGAAPAARALFEAMTSASGEGPRVDDEAVARFLQTVPADLRADEAQQLIERLRPASGQSLDEILGGLERAIRAIRAPEEGREGETEDDVTEGEPATPQPEGEGERVTADEFVERMIGVIHNFGAWGRVTADTQIISISDERGFNRIPIPSNANAFVFMKSSTARGGFVRSVAVVEMRVHSRSSRGGVTTASVSFISCGDFVREDRQRTPCTLRTGRGAPRVSITVLSPGATP